jgi:O-antigen/teichoic acid export membrane protein
MDDTGALFTAIGQPRRVTFILVVQALTLIIVATPLTLAFGAVGTAIGVGLAFAIGFCVAYRFIAQTLSLNLLRIFVPPALAALSSLLFYFALTKVADLNLLPLLIRVILKSGVTVGIFFAVILLIERQGAFNRLSYIRNLLRR